MFPRPLAMFFIFSCLCITTIAQEAQRTTASFIGRMGVDTVLVETYTIINNHIYGKAFTRVPEDYIADFSIHLYPDGSIREFNVNAMSPQNSSVPFAAKSGAFEYRLNMNCKDDTCTYYNSDPDKNMERVVKHAAKQMDFVGGWVPLISLLEWNCRRLAKSGKDFLPLKMINHNIGVYDIGMYQKGQGTMIFGGPFLEYTKISTDEEGKILSVDGTGTPWNYIVSRQLPINIDEAALRLSKTPGIGIPSPTETFKKNIKGLEFSLTYGRPYKRGREIFGGIVPYDSLWRTGANGPTTINLPIDIRIGKNLIPKGSYSIFTIPHEKEWTLILSSDLKSWPTDPDRTKDLFKFAVPVKKSTEPVQQFTITLQETSKGGSLQFLWDDVTATAEFEIPRSR